MTTNSNRMAPGTTFVWKHRKWTVMGFAKGQFARSAWRWVELSDIDPSTIRDIIPPQ